MTGRSKWGLIVRLVIVVVVVACIVAFMASTARESAVAIAGTLPVLGNVSDSAWAALAKKRILFGRQSVGKNILDGIAELARNDPRHGVQASALSTASHSNGIAHFLVGKNGDPASKTADFASTLDGLDTAEATVAGFELCYLDFAPDTDVRSVFGDYRRTIEAVRARHPQVQLMHFTAPLTVDEPRMKILAKRLLGRPTTRDLNAKRARYNALLREEYGTRDPLFDLAGAESTLENGHRIVSSGDGIEVESLASEFSDDGGHLNERGRRAVASRFLAFLATLP